MKKLENISKKVLEMSTPEERKDTLQKELSMTVFPDEFQLPLSPFLYCKEAIVSKCRVMESKKKPLWLTFTNSRVKNEQIIVMFKMGDDLRQDQLTLQMLTHMNNLWHEQSLEMMMSIYNCVSTGDNIGMLQVVPNSTTIASITATPSKKGLFKLTRKLNSAYAALGANDVLKEFLITESAKGLFF